MWFGDRRLIAAAMVTCVLVAGCSSSEGAGTRVSTPSTPVDSSAGGGVGVTLFPPDQRPSIPELSGTTLHGDPLTLSSLRGHVIVLNVWASWCGPCRVESPVLASVARATEGVGVRFVGLDEKDGSDAALAFSAAAGTTYPHIVDSDGALLASLGLVPGSAIPSTLVIDASGRVAARVIGAVDPATFEALVRSVVTAPTATPSS